MVETTTIGTLTPSGAALAAAATGDVFDSLQAQARAAFEQGQLAESAELFQQAIEWAETRGDRRRADLAFCNLCSATVGIDAVEPLPRASVARLREILMRNEDQINCRLAAYVLTRVYELGKDARKGLFYARIALDRSQLLERAEWVASARNQIGNMLIAQSFFEQAATEYQTALELYPEQAPVPRAVIEINLAYSYLARGHQRQGFSLLYRCLRLLRRLGARREQVLALIDLCYAHLDAGRNRDAIRYGERGLALAEEFEDADAIKNALYLVGQACHLQGEKLKARAYFLRLQSEHYPDSPGIPELLMAVDVRKMINLRA